MDTVRKIGFSEIIQGKGITGSEFYRPLAIASREIVDSDMEIIDLASITVDGVPIGAQPVEVKIPIMIGHNYKSLPVGVSEHWWVAGDPKTLYCRMKISNSEKGLITKIQEGIVSCLSIGFIVPRSPEHRIDEGNGVTRVQQGNIFELSWVMRPANSAARTIDDAAKRRIQQDWRHEGWKEIRNEVGFYKNLMEMGISVPQDSAHYSNIKTIGTVINKMKRGTDMEEWEQILGRVIKETGLIHSTTNVDPSRFSWQFQEFARLVKKPRDRMDPREKEFINLFETYLSLGESGGGKSIDNKLLHFVSDSDTRRILRDVGIVVDTVRR